MIADLVMSLAIFGFVPALVPAILSKQKPHRWTCFLTASLLTIITGCFAGMEAILIGFIQWGNIL